MKQQNYRNYRNGEQIIGYKGLRIGDGKGVDYITRDSYEGAVLNLTCININILVMILYCSFARRYH